MSNQAWKSIWPATGSRPGDTGTLHFEATITDLLFQDVTNRDYASFQITPTWFDDQYVSGLTNVQIAIHLPEGGQPRGDALPERSLRSAGAVRGSRVALWDFPAERLTGPNLVEIPSAVGIAGVQRMTVLDLAERWFVAQTTLRWVLGILAAGIFTYIFMCFTGGTGLTLWVISLAGLAFLFVRWPLTQLIAFLPLLLELYAVEQARQRRRAKAGYLPPIAQVEGGGIKRGLTAPEAAALLEMPLNKVLTLIIFGLLKVSCARPANIPSRSRSSRTFGLKQLKATRKRGASCANGPPSRRASCCMATSTFSLDAIEAKPDGAGAQDRLRRSHGWLLVNLAKRIKGFDSSDTQEYYQAIVRRGGTGQNHPRPR